jgi:glycosyltransferase involved in cell wall biosynthesis
VPSMSPVISVIIPTYNRATDLRRALASLMVQTCPDWEAIVVDNSSTDGTREVVDSFGDARIRFFSIVNRGVIAASRNLGIRNATGEYVAFLDSDDWWQSDKLEKCREAMVVDGGADLVYHRLYLVRSVDQARFHRCAHAGPVLPPVFGCLLVHGNQINNSSVVVRRSLLDEVGGACEDEDLAGAEDYDLWLRIAKITDRFRFLREPLGYYWVGGGNFTNPERVLRNIASIERRHGAAIAVLAKRCAVYSFSYVKGRAAYKCGRYTEAGRHLRGLLRQGCPLRIRLRTVWMLFNVMLHHLGGKWS